MVNVTVFGTKSGKLRVVVRRSNWPKVEVTIGSPAFERLPADVKQTCFRACDAYVGELDLHLRESIPL